MWFKKNKVLVVLVLLSLSVTMIIFMVFKLMYSVIETKSFSSIVNNTVGLMEVIRDVTVENLESRLEKEREEIEYKARLYGGRLLNTQGLEVSAALNSIPLPEYGLDYFFFTKDGQAFSAKGTAPAPYAENLESVWDGDIQLDGPALRTDGTFTMSFSAPVYRNGHVEGALSILLDGIYLSEWISDIVFPFGGGLAYIVDKNGTNIAVSAVENRDWALTAYNAQELVKNDPLIETVAELELRPLKGETGMGSYLWEGERNYLAYAPVPTPEWGLFVGFYGASLLQYARNITSGGVTVNQLSLVGLVLLLCVLSIIEVRWIGREQRGNRVLTEQKEALIALQKKTEEQSALLMEHHKTILDSLEYAKKIQGSLLSAKAECKGELSDFGLIWSPKDAVGGDLYWVRHFSGGTLLCVCDCTGHGVPGAMLTMLVVTALDAIVNEENCGDPAEIMWQLERKLMTVLNAQAGKDGGKNRVSAIRDGADLALLYVAADNSVIFSAGNTHVFVCDGTTVTDYKGQKMHIGEGALTEKAQIKTTAIPADKRNRFYIASDGYFDQIGGQKKMPFGYRTFKRIILEHHEDEMDAVIDKLWDAFEQHRGEEPRRDDVEVVAFRA